MEFRYRFTGRYFVSIYGDLSYYRYNDFFPKYDSWKRKISLSLSKGMSPEFEIVYRFLISEARGYDTSIKSKQNSDESDISYEEDMFSLVINKSIIIFEREIKMSFKENYYYRIYTSQKAYWIDPLHLGRTDKFYDLSGPARNSISKKMWMELGVNY